MSTIKYRIAAKTDVGLVRTNNEDNFLVVADLNETAMGWVDNQIYSLGDKGTLLVVADGMGGMNAGEVASALAIETIQDTFQPQNLTPEVVKNRFSIEKFMNSAIVAADTRIKNEGKLHPESRGMGTTIVIGWLLEGKLYLSWCGDSRAYVYNPDAGLHQISKDHSYVQTLVDKGAISKEDAFDYPESNIITRCLCDATGKAVPESLLQPYEVCDNDIILLCTDGLCGMIRDFEIEEVIRNNSHDMKLCADALVQAACDARGADNVTLALCQILQGAAKCNPAVFDAYDARLNGPQPSAKANMPMMDPDSTETTPPTVPAPVQQKSRKPLLIAIIAAAVVAIALALVFLLRSPKEGTDPSVNDSSTEQHDVSNNIPDPANDPDPDNSREQIRTTDNNTDNQSSPSSNTFDIIKDKKKDNNQNNNSNVDNSKQNNQGSQPPVDSANKKKKPTVTPTDPQTTYIIKKGDKLEKIVDMFRSKNPNLTVNDILKKNPTIKDKNQIMIGQTIIIPLK